MKIWSILPRRALLAALCSLPLFSIATDASDEATLQQVLEELAALRTTVEALEARVAALEGSNGLQPSVMDAAPVSRPSAPPRSSTGPLVENEPSMMDGIIDRLNGSDSGRPLGWYDQGKWSQLHKGMSADEVIAILGKPLKDEPSLNRRIDRVLTYIGRRLDTRERVIGKVRFDNDKLVEIEAPQF